jgi:hypothetical protein
VPRGDFADEGIKDQEDEIKHTVETAKLTGLMFEKLWQSDETA